ncbi:MAG: 2-oxo acid dehydrogenase subunit E2 [Bryobacterales bacterium]|nr:2-oxo acid dehydrogenase subunit E2 [Bryobacterales bacterium]
MPIEITVPRLGWSAEEGTFAGWLKQPGDTVSSGEPLFALESDKVTMEVESLDNGILEVAPDCPEPGGTVVVGQLLGYLTTGEPRKANLPASPRAKAAAKRLGIDLTTITPRPNAHRIIEADVLKAAPAPALTPKPRHRIASKLEESFRAPHFYLQAEPNATNLARFREELLPILEQKHGVRVTYNDLLLKAVALSLRAVPQVNAYWQDNTTIANHTTDVGLAVQTGDTLLVPVIHDADLRTLAEIAHERERLILRCQRGEAKPADFEGGGATISNLGSYGVDRFQAILNPPQAAILAVGRLAKRPVVEGDAVVARLTLPLTLSVDHRVADGVLAARFLQSITSLLESPLRLLL